MQVSIVAALLFAIPVLCASRNAGANEALPQALSVQELDANVTGISLAITDRAEARNGRTAFLDTNGARFGNLAGIQNNAIDAGAGSVSQAVTSLVVRGVLRNAPLF